MPGTDRDLVRPLQKRIEKRYERILLDTRVSKLEANGRGLRATFEGPQAPEPEEYDRVLVAVGRSANGNAIDAAAAGVTVDKRGIIGVDKQMRTNVPHIFAVGDIAGAPMLAHKATHEAKVAAEVAAGHKAAFDARCIPSVAYTDPEIAWVGVNESRPRPAGSNSEKACSRGLPAAALSPSAGTTDSPRSCSTSRAAVRSAPASSAPRRGAHRRGGARYRNGSGRGGYRF